MAVPASRGTFGESRRDADMSTSRGAQHQPHCLPRIADHATYSASPTGTLQLTVHGTKRLAPSADDPSSRGECRRSPCMVLLDYGTSDASNERPSESLTQLAITPALSLRGKHPQPRSTFKLRVPGPPAFS